VSTNTLVSDIIAEHDARQRTQQTRTPKEVHARMIEMTNAANGLRYEVARFGDIERQLKAVHEKMEPLVLKAKELNDLICERVSQASQPWANSGIHESEELLQKVQQLERENAEQCVLLGKGGERECALLGKVERLERENAELRRDVYQCPPTSENDYEGFKWADAFDVIEHNNAKLHNEVTALKRENLSLREARKPVAVPGLHGLVTWYADAQQLGEAFQREREKCIRFEEVMQSQGDEIRRLTAENDALHKTLSAAIDAARKEDQP
jgi:hypothetical protein